MLVYGSITDRLVDFATNVVGDLGVAGIFALMVPESACIPIPSEATMLFAGFNVSKGDYTLLAAVSAGVAANVIGSWYSFTKSDIRGRISPPCQGQEPPPTA